MSNEASKYRFNKEKGLLEVWCSVSEKWISSCFNNVIQDQDPDSDSLLSALQEWKKWKDSLPWIETIRVQRVLWVFKTPTGRYHVASQKPYWNHLDEYPFSGGSPGVGWEFSDNTKNIEKDLVFSEREIVTVLNFLGVASGVVDRLVACRPQESLLEINIGF